MYLAQERGPRERICSASSSASGVGSLRATIYSRAAGCEATCRRCSREGNRPAASGRSREIVNSLSRVVGAGRYNCELRRLLACNEFQLPLLLQSNEPRNQTADVRSARAGGGLCL